MNLIQIDSTLSLSDFVSVGSNGDTARNGSRMGTDDHEVANLLFVMPPVDRGNFHLSGLDTACFSSQRTTDPAKESFRRDRETSN
jgi:hypothetical protein